MAACVIEAPSARRTVGVKGCEIEGFEFEDSASRRVRSQFVRLIGYCYTRVGIAYLGAACLCRYTTIHNVHEGERYYSYMS